jgi:hypothetical protein
MGGLGSLSLYRGESCVGMSWSVRVETEYILSSQVCLDYWIITFRNSVEGELRYWGGIVSVQKIDVF